MTLTVENVIICDDARQEISGKYILIGVYTGILGTRRLPLNFRPTWWLQVRGASGPHKYDFRVLAPNNVSLFEGQIEFALGTEGPGAFAIPRGTLQIQSTGKLRLEWRQSGASDWAVIKELDIVVGSPSSPATSSAPPVEQSPSDAPAT
jgi:hypothetical protein